MSDAQQDPEAALFVEDREPQPVLSIRTNVAIAQLAHGPHRGRRATGRSGDNNLAPGAHDSLGQAYDRLNAWLEEHEREAAGPAWEVYWWIDARQEPDPSSWPAPTEWRTELVQPIA
jgi:hypothetical protein